MLRNGKEGGEKDRDWIKGERLPGSCCRRTGFLGQALTIRHQNERVKEILTQPKKWRSGQEHKSKTN